MLANENHNKKEQKSVLTSKLSLLVFVIKIYYLLYFYLVMNG